MHKVAVIVGRLRREFLGGFVSKSASHIKRCAGQA